MERLTVNDLNEVCYDPWELCGMDGYCRKGCHDEGGCTDGCHILKMYRKLAEYEDLEEQGELLKPPPKVSEVWYIDVYADDGTEIIRGVVEGYSWYRSRGFALNVVWDKRIMGSLGYKRKEVLLSKIGKTVFLTKEEAEAALKGSRA